MKIDRCIQEDNVPIALREDKLEFGHGGSDPYMQIARCYDLVVGVLTDHSTKDINASNFLTHGAPCFLICLIGTQCCSLVLASVDLILPRVHAVICGGFFDGHKPVVEPLGQPVFMLADHTRTRQGEVARLLGALVRGISSLRRCLTFVSRPNNAYQRLFLATLSSRSIPDLQVLVRLVPRSY